MEEQPTSTLGKSTQPTPSGALPISPSTSSPKFPPPLIAIFVLLLVFVGAISFFLGKSLSQTKTPSLPPISQFSPSPIPEVPTPTPDPTANWKTYRNEKYGFEFKYPSHLHSLISSNRTIISAKTKQEIIDEYQEYQKSGGCPSTCGILAENQNLLQKQLLILSKINEQPDCILTDDYKKEVEDDFILFTRALGNKINISGIKTIQKKCGLKIIEFDGFDVSLTNYYYKAGFINENKIIEISFEIFPHNAFEKVDKLWLSFGASLDGSCDASCYNNEVEYYEKFNLNDDVVKEVISTYDLILSTFKFLD